MASNFANYYASRRDSAGVPVLLPSDWPRFSEPFARETYLSLASRTARLRECYGEIDFLRLRVLPSAASGHGHHIPRAQQSHTLVRTVNEELEDIDCRYEEHTAVLRLLYVLQAALAGYQLGPNPHSLSITRRSENRCLEPQMLLAVFTPGASHAYYSAELGLRSSRSRLNPPAESVQALMNLGILSREYLESHHASRKRPSPFIFLTDNTKRLLNDSSVAKHRPFADDSRRVAFVNVEKLRRMGAVYGRSDLLAAQASITVSSAAQQDGMGLAGVDYWLVYDWIPTQCIERIVSFADYRQLYVVASTDESVLRCTPEELLISLRRDPTAESLTADFEGQSLE